MDATMMRAAVAALAVLLAGCSEAGEVDGTTDSPPAGATATAATAEIAGTVEVTVVDLEGAAGGVFAGTLMPGRIPLFGEEDLVLGGFVVEVTEDPTDASATVTTPGEDWEGVWPYVTDEPVVLTAGDYVIQLWAAPTELGPYGRWVPGSDDTEGGFTGWRGCHVAFTAEAGQDTSIVVQGLPLWHLQTRSCDVA